MGFVDHDEVVLGEHRIDGDRQGVQVQVDDQDVGFRGLVAGLLSETVVASRAAVRPGAFVASDGDEAPGAVVDRFELAAISCGGCGGEGSQLVERLAVDRAAVSFGVVEVEIESVVGLEFVEPLETEIIRSSFENGETEWDVEVIGEEREILPGELILKRFGGGGDDRRSVR